jgi:hypothetical protein
VFSEEEAVALPGFARTEHAIDIEPGQKIPHGTIYPLSANELRVLREYLQTNLALGRIRRSKSPAGAPILFAPKKDGGLRLCVDYRALNRITIKNRHPLPLINETIDRLAHAKVYTKLDLKDAYHRIRIKRGHEWMTAFRTRYGHFEYLVMPFGLTNAPATFQAYINEASSDLLDIICVAYLDDIVVYSESVEEHEDHVRQVLDRLRKYSLYCKLSKCQFSTTEMEFLGFIVGTAGVSMDPRRVATVRDWPPPESYHDIQIFLGFANFYRRFIHRYSAVVAPITNLLKGMQKGRKSGPFDWPDEAKEAFCELKKRFTEAPMLQHYRPECKTRLETDASGEGIAGIVSQFVKPDGHAEPAWHPIAFFSRKQSPAEQNYEVHDAELLAIVESFKEWRHYLEGAAHTVEVLCDHSNLKYFMTTKSLSRRQARWAERLAAFDFDIKYRKGGTNPADGPSRRPDYKSNSTGDKLLLPVLQQKLKWHGVPADHWESENNTQAMGTYVGVLTRGQARDEAVVGGDAPDQESLQVSTAGHEREACDVLQKRTNGEEPFGGPEAKGLTFMIPRRDVVAAAKGMSPYEEIPDTFTKHLLLLQNRDAWCKEKAWEGYPDNEVRKGLFRGRWHVDQAGLVRCDGGVYVPNDPATRLEIFRLNHDNPWQGGHFGIKRTEEVIRRHYYWPEYKNDVRDHVSTCDICQRMKAPRHKPYGLLKPLPRPTSPWKDIAMDFITGLPPAGRRGKAYDAILVVVDRYSKMARYIACTKDIDAPELAERLCEEIVSKFGMPESIVTDRGSLFTSAWWTTFCHYMKVKRRMSTAFRPQTDGQTERQNQTLEAYLRCYVNHRQDDWVRLLPSAEFAYNNSVNASTGMTPFGICYRWKPSLRINPDAGDDVIEGEAPDARRVAEEIDIEESTKLWQSTQEASRKYYNQKHKAKSYAVGDEVRLSTQHIKLRKPSKKLTEKFVGPFKVIDIVGQNAYTLELPKQYDRLHQTFHVSLLEPYRRREGEELPGPTMLDGEEGWEVERILDERKSKGKRMFLVKWLGFTPDQNTWEPMAHLVNVQEKLEEFFKEREAGKQAKKQIFARRSAKKSRKRVVKKKLSSS